MTSRFAKPLWFVLVTSFFGVVGDWFAGATGSAVGDRPALVVVLFVLGMAALFVYQIVFDDFATEPTARGYRLSWPEPDVHAEITPLAEAAQILLIAIAFSVTGAILAMLPLLGSIIDLLRQPLLRIPVHPPWLLFIVLALVIAIVLTIVDAPDGAIIGALIVIGILTVPLARPWFGPEHRFTNLVDDAIAWESELRWLEGGRATSIAPTSLDVQRIPTCRSDISGLPLIGSRSCLQHRGHRCAKVLP